MPRSGLFTAIAILLAMCTTDARAAAIFKALGDLSGEVVGHAASGVSADGSVVVGTGSSASGLQAFRWTEAAGMVGLGDLPGGGFHSNALAVSADGSVVVGRSRSASGFEAFRWTEAAGMVGLGDLPGGDFESLSRAVSADGSVVVGQGSSASGFEAFRWTEAAGMVGLGDPGDSRATGVSADGSVVVGAARFDSGFEAFRWTEAGGMVGLGTLGASVSSAEGVSADGSVVVGGSNTISGHQAFRWTEAGGMVGLGDPGDSRATGVSADGSVVVGNIRNEPFIWDETAGMRTLQQLLIDDFGLGADLLGWSLKTANAVSADGRTIVGSGTNPQGEAEAYLVRFLPEPLDTGKRPQIMIFDPLAVAQYNADASYSLKDVAARFDPSLPTVIFTHGWQRDGDYPIISNSTNYTAQLMKAFDEKLNKDSDGFLNPVNLLGVTWENAHQGARGARDAAQSSAQQFVLDLEKIFVDGYSKPTHLIGHSYGSYFNLHALEAIYKKDSFKIAHVTTLDAPFVAPFGIGTVSNKWYQAFAANEKYKDVFFDNYFGVKPTSLVVLSREIPGWQPTLKNKFGWDVGGRGLEEDHTGVWKNFYLGTIKNVPLTSGDGARGFNKSAVLTEVKKPIKPLIDFVGPMIQEALLTANFLAGATFDALSSVLWMMTESNAYAQFDIEIPTNAEIFLFELLFEQAGEFDWLEVVINGELSGVYHAALFSELETTIYIDLFEQTPGKVELYFLLVDASGTGSSLTARNFRFWLQDVTETTPIPVPATVWLVLTGLVCLAGFRRFTTS